MASSRIRGGPPEAVETAHKGVIFRSALEANWAQNLDRYHIEWQYEPELLRLPSGTGYLPDFWLPELRTYIEVKGAHMQRIEKTRELAIAVLRADILVLLGFDPGRDDPRFTWRDPLGCDMRFALCSQCRAYQWIRPGISMDCRKCGDTLAGFLAESGDMEFTTSAGMMAGDIFLTVVRSLRRGEDIPRRTRR